MARPHLVSPDQPLPLRVVLHIYQFAASLRLAVVLILSLAATLALGTFVEARWDTPVAQFFVYRSWWFNVLLAMLALNIFCAAAIRFPWKKHQTGFVITHAGLLTLVAGTAMQRMNGIDAQIPILEGQMKQHAIEDREFFFSIEIRKPSETTSDPHSAEEEVEKIEQIAFSPGPFNWTDYETEFDFVHPDDFDDLPEEQEPTFIHKLRKIPSRLFRWGCGKVFAVAARDRENCVVYDDNGIKVEVLQFFMDSRRVDVPAIEAKISMPPQKRIGLDGKEVEPPRVWMPVRLSVRETLEHNQSEYPNGMGGRTRTGGGFFLFWISGSEAQTQAFLAGAPKDELGPQGQVVLHVGGKTIRFRVDEKIGAGKFPIAGTDFEAEVLEFWNKAELRENEESGKLEWREALSLSPENPAVRIAVYKKGESSKSGELLLVTNQPELNVHDYNNQVFGDYWFDYSGMTSEERQQLGVSSRIDIIQGHDLRLYYRYWNTGNKEVVFAQELPIDGSAEQAVDAFKMPIGQLKMYVQDFIPSAEPKRQETLPKKFERGLHVTQKSPSAQIRMTVDGETKEFWLQPRTFLFDSPDEPPVRQDHRYVMQNKDRSVALKMALNAIDIGFRIKLNRFERKLDPGTSQASHFSSTVDLVDRHANSEILRAALDGSEAEPMLLDGLTQADAIALDSSGEYLYWTDSSERRIQRARLTGSREPAEVETIVDELLAHQPAGIAIDAHDKLYWADVHAGHRGDIGIIRRVDLDGANPQTVIQTVGTIGAIAIDSRNDKIYWIEPRNGIINSANLDGSGRAETPIHKDVFGARDLAVDSANGLIYWTQTIHPKTSGKEKTAKVTHEIRSSKLDGSDVTPVVSRGEHEMPVGLAIDQDNGRIYWCEQDTTEFDASDDPANPYVREHRIMSLAAAGGRPEVLVSEDVDAPSDIVIEADGGSLIWVQEATFDRNVWITMNAPVEFADPYTGRKFRLFQESYAGPIKPGESIDGIRFFEDVVPATSRRQELYRSVLTVNYDPGRGVRVIGCLMICCGIFTMFYMRAYFFKRRPRDSADAPVQ